MFAKHVAPTSSAVRHSQSLDTAVADTPEAASEFPFGSGQTRLPVGSVSLQKAPPCSG